jgi:hypothetical protein
VAAGFVGLVGGAQGVAEVDVDLGEIGTELEGSPCVRDGLLDVAVGKEEVGKVGAGDEAVGISRDGGALAVA